MGANYRGREVTKKMNVQFDNYAGYSNDSNKAQGDVRNFKLWVQFLLIHKYSIFH